MSKEDFVQNVMAALDARKAQKRKKKEHLVAGYTVAKVQREKARKHLRKGR